MTYKVLLVDDDKMVLFLHKFLVNGSELPSGPITFSDGKEVLDFLIEEKSSNCLYFILLDLNMPGMNGWEFLENLQTFQDLKNRTFVAIVTSSINNEDWQKAERYPQVIHYVEKPLTREVCNELGEKVRENILKRKN